MGNAYIHQPLPLDESESDIIEAMMDAAIKSYMAIAITSSGQEPDVDIEQEMNWAENRMYPPEEQ
jgi:hypothetical protein